MHEVAAETLALFRQALAELRRRAGTSMDDAALLEMARHVLAGPSDEGRSSYQSALAVCPACGGGMQEAAGELVGVGPEVVARAGCDAEHLCRVDQQPANDACTDVAVPKSSPPSKRDRAHVGAGAKQSIPPAVRRAVLRRDHQRCRVPGSRNATFLDVHHIELRSEAGSNDADNLLTVCGAHHRALHRGELTLDGTSGSNVRFHHAGGSMYGKAPDPKTLDVQAKVFGGLRNLGFREGDIRHVLSELRNDASLDSATPGDSLRAALERLTLIEY